jgi:glycosyltransferase involved in cell wall biosynthesis
MSECKQSTDENLPFVSIIIPVRNEEKFIESTLMACLKQDYPEDRMEIIVVDGISTDKTGMILREMSENDHRIKLAKNEKKITPVSLNIGIKESKGDILVIVGGHSEINKEFIKNAVVKLNYYKDVWAVGGTIETVGESTVAKVIAEAMSSRFGVGNSLFRTLKKKQKDIFVDTVPFAAFPRWVFDRVGLFDEQFVRTQDYEMNLRIRKMGGKILLSPEIRSIYFSRRNLRGLFRQYFQYGFYKTKVIKKHKMRIGIRYLIPPVGFVIFLMTLIVGLLTNCILLPILLLSCYLLILLLGMGVSLTDNFKKEKLLLPVVFAVLHLSFSLGFITGLFSKRLFLERK